jgi:hypothetical protein
MSTKELKIQINPINIQSMNVTIVGQSPLIFNRFSEKAKQMIKDKVTKVTSSNIKKEPKNPEQLYEDSFYYTKDHKIAFPALNIKQAIVSAARNVEGLPMTLLRGGVFVKGDETGMIEVKYKMKEMREDMVRVGTFKDAADIRFRGQVSGWSMTFLIKFNADLFTAGQVINLLNIAGFSGGLGEWRPEKNGDFGTFTVKLS